MENKFLYWSPRILSILMVLFFGIFILEGLFWGQILLSFVILVIAITAWKWSNIGGCLFILLGIFFLWFFHPLWLSGFIIGGAAVLIGVLFLITSKMCHRKKT